MAIEATKRRANDASTTLKAAGPPSQVMQAQALSGTATGHSTTSCTNDPDLAAVVEAWSELPEPMRAGILAMVRTVNDGPTA